MPSLPTLHIAEYESFTQDDIKICLDKFCRSKNKSLNFIESKAQKIFAELQEFAKQKNNGSFLRFWGSNTLKAQNYVGLIQTKSGFCVEILPKTFDKDFGGDNLCDYHKGNTNKAPKIKFGKQKFATKVEECLKHITSNPKAIAENKESKNQNAQQDRPQCSICQSKQILLNCLATLKDSPFRQSHIASLQSLNLPLLEVFIQMFLAELERLIHRGLKSDYREIAQNRAFLKGKLLFNEQIKHNLIHKERFFTQSDEYSLNSAPNRLIKRTLEFLHTLSLSPKTRTKLDSLYFIFEEITPSSHIERDFAKCKSMRRFKEYELVLLWCAIFLRQKSFSAYSGSERAFALLFPMERLFESFVGHWLGRSIEHHEIKLQEQRYHFMQDFQKVDIFQLKPDVIMRSESEILILDTKWKIPDSTNDEKRYGIAQSDVYQMWAYASKYALESTLQNTKSKLDSKGIKSQKAPEITELESSTDCKKIEANKPKQLKVWLIYPLCERTQALQEKWQKPTQGQPKQWYFKASIPHNKSHKTHEENQENGTISLFVAFFPLTD